jgi:putative glutamine amidotransferase
MDPLTGVRPLIGVSTSEVRLAGRTQPADQSEPQRRELALGMTYLSAVEAAGGIPVILAPLCPAGTEALLDRLDGICLSGGPDITPTSYRAAAHPELGPTEPDLDRFELDLARRARVRGLPVLGICRGAQLLNVSRGGTLFQHLPDVVGDAIEHRQADVSGEVSHTVRVRPGSRVAEIVGTAPLHVNSFHHQAVDGLGAGLRAVAWADDGVVEAIEAPVGEFAVGVQWHAESLTAANEHAALFRALVEAAAGRIGALDVAEAA